MIILLFTDLQEEHAVWEEKYKSHNDAKPNGELYLSVCVSHTVTSDAKRAEHKL